MLTGALPAPDAARAPISCLTQPETGKEGRRRRIAKAMQPPLLMLAVLPNGNHRSGPTRQATFRQKTVDQREVPIRANVVG